MLNAYKRIFFYQVIYSVYEKISMVMADSIQNYNREEKFLANSISVKTYIQEIIKIIFTEFYSIWQSTIK